MMTMKKKMQQREAAVARMESGFADQAKVRIIVTRFVHTDKENFKSVVQSLTGKDSSVTTDPQPQPQPQPQRPVVAGHRDWRRTLGGGTNGEGGPGLRNLAQTRLPELDRVLMELPSLEELEKLWAD